MMGWTPSTLSPLHSAFLLGCEWQEKKVDTEVDVSSHIWTPLWRNSPCPTQHCKEHCFLCLNPHPTQTPTPNPTPDLTPTPTPRNTSSLSSKHGTFYQNKRRKGRVLSWVSSEANGMSTVWRLPADFPWILQMNWVGKGTWSSYRQNRGEGCSWGPAKSGVSVKEPEIEHHHPFALNNWKVFKSQGSTKKRLPSFYTANIHKSFPKAGPAM